jgi:hypothetical protein
LTATDALRLLSTPLRLLLENRRADFLFLLRVAPTKQRERLKDAVRRGWIEPEQAGGLGEMRIRLMELFTAPTSDDLSRIQRLRLFAMFDRDSDENDRSQPSRDSKAMNDMCGARWHHTDPWQLQYLQLHRRSIESYIPTNRLRLWGATHRTGRDATRYEQRVRSLERLRVAADPRIAWQFNMKDGLLRDMRPTDRKRVSLQCAPRGGAEAIAPDELGTYIANAYLDPLFRSLSARDRGSLAFGFGDDVAQVFYDGGLEWDPEFQSEYDRGPTTQPSRAAIMDSLFSRA